MTELLVNQGYVIIVRNRALDSSVRFYRRQKVCQPVINRRQTTAQRQRDAGQRDAGQRDDGQRDDGQQDAELTSLSDSTNTWSYSLSATRNMIDVTFSKQ